ncbi:hypothetical protein AXF42_Ash008892 [Apostasia shenzhenica]|uniref:Uncharacterized protein n=1 Tax=Apostasia shenzhenica TaxID=1088818 RepID=A0A2I0AST4_9ASPA|nr:hypothetical protein AXF42_Ash008892 [Apostasia shenzhenica]
MDLGFKLTNSLFEAFIPDLYSYEIFDPIAWDLVAKYSDAPDSNVGRFFGDWGQGIVARIAVGARKTQSVADGWWQTMENDDGLVATVNVADSLADEAPLHSKGKTMAMEESSQSDVISGHIEVEAAPAGEHMETTTTSAESMSSISDEMLEIFKAAKGICPFEPFVSFHQVNKL